MSLIIRLSAMLLVLTWCAGCTRDATEVVPTAAEQASLAKLTSDAFVHVVGYSRNQAKILVVTTQQGEETVRYLVHPSDGPASSADVRRIDDAAHLRTGDAAAFNTGTGPDQRGITR